MIQRHSRLLALGIILLVAAALRIHTIFTEVYVIHADETLQYFEQAHRLAFGSGIVPWEFQDGVRSWLVPGFIAGVMRATSVLSSDPMLYVRTIRIGCALFSLTVVYVGFSWAYCQYGLAAAALTGSICAIWFELIYFSPAVLTEVLSAHAALWAIYLGDTTPDNHKRATLRLVASGAWFGLAGCLKFQYAPALLLGAVRQHGLNRRRWIALIAGSLVTIIPIGGVLDFVTWGAPFQSIWFNVVRNALQNASGGFGTEPWTYYPHWIWWTWQAAALFAVLALIGMYRLPALALTTVAVVGFHELVPHKEYRFIYLALASAPILIGVGASAAADYIGRKSGSKISTLSYLVAFCTVGAVSWYAETHGVMARHFQSHRKAILTMLEAHRQPDLCGLGQADLPFADSGGYTYLHRDVPMYFSSYAAPADPSVSLLGRTQVMFHGALLPQFHQEEFLQHANRFNYIIAPDKYMAAGFEPKACFQDESSSGGTSICLYHRSGNCD